MKDVRTYVHSIAERTMYVCRVCVWDVCAEHSMIPLMDMKWMAWHSMVRNEMKWKKKNLNLFQTTSFQIFRRNLINIIFFCYSFLFFQSINIGRCYAYKFIQIFYDFIALGREKIMWILFAFITYTHFPCNSNVPLNYSRLLWCPITHMYVRRMSRWRAGTAPSLPRDRQWSSQVKSTIYITLRNQPFTLHYYLARLERLQSQCSANKTQDWAVINIISTGTTAWPCHCVTYKSKSHIGTHIYNVPAVHGIMKRTANPKAINAKIQNHSDLVCEVISYAIHIHVNYSKK